MQLKHSLFFYAQAIRGPSGASTCCVGVRSGQSVVVCVFLLDDNTGLLDACAEVSVCSLTQSLRPVTPGFVSNGLTSVSQQFLDATDQLSKQTFQREAF